METKGSIVDLPLQNLTYERGEDELEVSPEVLGDLGIEFSDEGGVILPIGWKSVNLGLGSFAVLM